MPELLRGMFAFALWDARRATLLLARDRFGEKPLYYGERPDGFVFASELGALLADERTPATLSLPALDAYLALQYVPSPDTIYEGLKSFPPGTRCRSAAASGRWCGVTIVPASLPRWPTSTSARPRRACAPRWRRRCSDRLMSDVPLGAFLSGGVDSSIVVACMARATGAPVKTFSIGFSEGGRADNELPFARLVAERYRTDHHELIVAPDMTGLLPSIVRHHGEPFGDSSAIPTYYLCQLARRHVTVALSGDAGDESFGGYRRYVWAQVADLLLPAPAAAPRLVAAALGAVPGGPARWLREYGARLATDGRPATSASSVIFRPARRPTSIRPSCASGLRATPRAEAFAAQARRQRGPATSWAACKILDRDTYLPDDILAKVDIASMSHGLEARAPFCDHDVVELGAALPGRFKLRRGKGKFILKQAFADLVPPAIIERRKKGFALPTGRWLAGRLHGFARELLLSTAARQRGLFAPAAVESLLDRHRAGEDHGERIWNLMVLEPGFESWSTGGRRSCERRPRARPRLVGPNRPAGLSVDISNGVTDRLALC